MPTPFHPRLSGSRPFMTLPRVDSFYAARDAREAIESLERAVDRAEGIGLVVGPTGTGKSLLLACLQQRLEDRFAVALLSGARICTRRGLWQSVLADIGEAYRGLDEEELRIGLVDRIRGLAATGSGLVVLVDEAHALPRRLLEELRLLVGVVTAQPAVHLVLAGTVRLEELLGDRDLEGLAQRIAVRGYLEPLDYEDTCGFLRTQMRAAGMAWEDHFTPDCDAAVYTITEGVPRLINQLCDQALRLAGEQRAQRVGTAELAAAWEEIQRLPPPAALRTESAGGQPASAATAAWPLPAEPSAAATAGECTDFEKDEEAAIIEFGSLEDEPEADPPAEANEKPAGSRTVAFAESWAVTDESRAATQAEAQPAEADSPAEATAINFKASRAATDYAVEALARAVGGFDGLDTDAEVMMRLRHQPADSPPGRLEDEIELIFDPPFATDEPERPDLFAELFADEEPVPERFVMQGPDTFQCRMHVASREGQAIGRQLPDPAAAPPAAATGLDDAGPGRLDSVSPSQPTSSAEATATDETALAELPEPDDSDMVVIEEDSHPDPNTPDGSIFAVRLGDYSQLFARLRRGGHVESSRRA